MKGNLIHTLSALICAVILLTGHGVTGAQTGARNHQGQVPAAAPSGNTPGRIAKFTNTKTVGDSNITEDNSGNIGIGTTLPSSKLTVNGIIEMLSGGAVKFPDGTLQTTAGLADLAVDTTLKGKGTQASPVGVNAPLILNGGQGARGIIQATNTTLSGVGVEGKSSMEGIGVVGIGGVASSVAGGTGVAGAGGDSYTGLGGQGVFAVGGIGGLIGGTGVNAGGGAGLDLGGIGGDGVHAAGGDGNGIGKRGGIGIVAEGGTGLAGAAKGLAGRFLGDVQVTGTLSKAGGSFKIDHPLDPENKYLSHSFVESPDMMNIYNGNVTTDHSGLAVVELPDYFESLNREFRYQLTVLGQFAQAIVAQEVKDNHFTIQTSEPGVKVSWQVTGIRHDAWANKNRIRVEESKSETERGHYLHPEAFGKEDDVPVDRATPPELTREQAQPDQIRKPHQIDALKKLLSGERANRHVR